MAVTCGFYNSINHDRRYDAIQMSSIFDGIVRDGVFMSIGTCFVAEASPVPDMSVVIGIGRCWFNHSWLLNDALLPIVLDQSELLQDRIDTIVIDVDSSDAVRFNDIIVVKGQPHSTNPQPPTLIKSLTRNQYPICNVLVRKNVTHINQADITNRVGTSDCPFVTGILDTVDIDLLIQQWGDQWMQAFGDWSAQWNAWFLLNTTQAMQEMLNWKNQRQDDFDTWFQNLQDILDDDVAATLAQRLLELEQRMNVVEDFQDRLSTEFTVIHTIDDENGDCWQDHLGNPIDGQIIFCIKPCGCKK